MQYNDAIFMFTGNASDKNSIVAYQVAFGVIIPAFVIIIIAGVVFYLLKHHPLKLSTSTKRKGENVSPIYENQELSNVAQQNMENQANASDPTYEQIDTADIDINSSVYEMVETVRVEYMNVHWGHWYE